MNLWLIILYIDKKYKILTVANICALLADCPGLLCSVLHVDYLIHLHNHPRCKCYYNTHYTDKKMEALC